MSQSVSEQPIDHVPEAVATIARYMHGFPAPWALCGGWAVDAWIGRVTREHGDIDVTVFADDQQALIQHLREWQFLAHYPAWSPGPNEEWWTGAVRLPPGTHIHTRPPEFSSPMPANGIARDEDGFKIEFNLDDRASDDWTLSRDPSIRLPMLGAIARSGWGIPTAVPEVLLFFKARSPSRPRDWQDFRALLPHLSDAQRTWLSEAIATLGHPWLADLTDAGAARRSP